MKFTSVHTVEVTAYGPQQSSLNLCVHKAEDGQFPATKDKKTNNCNKAAQDDSILKQTTPPEEI
jgi:hypothetical protein